MTQKQTYFLRGQRLYLREVRVSDVNERYYQWLNDPDINQYLETRFVPRSIENITEFVRRLDGNSNEPFFAICLIDDNSHIGNIKLGPINWYHRYADISLFIGEKHLWGQGYAREAIQLVTDFAFQTLNLNKLKAGCYAENLGSAKAFEKCGYEREGLLKGHIIDRGQEIDIILLGLRGKKYWNQSITHQTV
jgi:[ribosomal protein S5]-alanine N-acetyltransferase